MSRTDKDVPYRVHVTRVGRESHDHSRGDCDIDEWEWDYFPVWRSRTSCRKEIGGRYFYTLTFFPRRPIYRFWQRTLNDGDNARVRRRLTEVRKLHFAGEDIEFEDVPNFQHRHSAAWEMW